MREDCCVAVKIQSSQFNSSNTGYTFWFHIKTFPKQISLETLKEWTAWSDSIHEDSLLPDCGKDIVPYGGTHLGYAEIIQQEDSLGVPSVQPFTDIPA